MTKKEHYTRLENIYFDAPINQFFKSAIEINEEKAEISIDVKEEYFLAPHAVHGSVFFDMLDDTAFFCQFYS